jgi:ComF family protein
MRPPLSIASSVFFNTCAKFAQHLLPQQCLLCTAPAADQPLCEHCHAGLPRLTCSHCPQCAMPTLHGEICGACIADPPAFTTVSAAFVYAWPLTTLIQQFKYAGNLALTRMLADAIRAPGLAAVDIIIPMPLAPARLRQRGFNQALELARHVGAALRTRIDARAIRRVRDSAPQAMLPWRERAKNIRGAFVYGADLSGMRVAVVDDVLTTGATLNELARTLRRAGATEVHGWMAARTLKRA